MKSVLFSDILSISGKFYFVLHGCGKLKLNRNDIMEINLEGFISYLQMFSYNIQ